MSFCPAFTHGPASQRRIPSNDSTGGAGRTAVQTRSCDRHVREMIRLMDGHAALTKASGVAESILREKSGPEHSQASTFYMSRLESNGQVPTVFWMSRSIMTSDV